MNITAYGATEILRWQRLQGPPGPAAAAGKSLRASDPWGEWQLAQESSLPLRDGSGLPETGCVSFGPKRAMMCLPDACRSWHEAQSAAGGWVSSAACSEACGWWQKVHWPSLAGGWITFFAIMDWSWQVKQSAGGSFVRSFGRSLP